MDQFFFNLRRWYWIADDLIDMLIQIIHDKHFRYDTEISLQAWTLQLNLGSDLDS